MLFRPCTDGATLHHIAPPLPFPLESSLTPPEEGPILYPFANGGSFR